MQMLELSSTLRLALKVQANRMIEMGIFLVLHPMKE